jgi:hypothetical protein
MVIGRPVLRRTGTFLMPRPGETASRLRSHGLTDNARLSLQLDKAIDKVIRRSDSASQNLPGATECPYNRRLSWRSTPVTLRRIFSADIQLPLFRTTP